MHVIETIVAGNNRAIARSAATAVCRLEKLEGRTLFSGWTTVDDLAPVQGNVLKMTSDVAGNVYAMGRRADLAGAHYDIIRMKASGAAGWTTILDQFGVYGTRYTDIAVNAAGDVYVVGSTEYGTNAFHSSVWEMKRSVGESSFTLIDQQSN